MYFWESVLSVLLNAYTQLKFRKYIDLTWENQGLPKQWERGGPQKFAQLPFCSPLKCVLIYPFSLLEKYFILNNTSLPIKVTVAGCWSQPLSVQLGFLQKFSNSSVWV